MDRTHPSSHTPFTSLTSPEKLERMHRLRSTTRVKQQKVERLKRRLSTLSEKRGIEIDDSLHSDLKQIMAKHTKQVEEMYPPDSFQQIFWEQQQKAAAQKKAMSMKWHPLMIR